MKRRGRRRPAASRSWGNSRDDSVDPVDSLAGAAIVAEAAVADDPDQQGSEDLMSPVMTFRIAFKALGRNKMRTGLTMLGMIIGVSAVITLVALGNGAQSAIEDQIKSAGTNMITVNAGNFTTGGVRQGSGAASTLT